MRLEHKYDAVSTPRASGGRRRHPCAPSLARDARTRITNHHSLLTNDRFLLKIHRLLPDTAGRV